MIPIRKQRLPALTLALALQGALALPVAGQGVELAHRPVAEIRIVGLERVSEQLIRNQIRLQAGEPYDPAVQTQDIQRITHLGKVSSVRVDAQALEDGSVRLTYVVSELPLLADVQVVGNKALSDQELLRAINLRTGDPIDSFLVFDRGVRAIKDAYRQEGYFATEVSVDQEHLNESGLAIYRIREGPRPRIAAIDFQGNRAFGDKQLRSRIRSRTKLGFLRKGEMNREQLDADVASVRTFYQDSGYLDAQVGRRIDMAPDQRRAVVVFQIEEGRRYIVHSIRVEGNQVFSTPQLLEAMALRQGDVASADLIRRSQEALQELYGRLGFIESRIQVDRLFGQENAPEVDLHVRIEEGNPYLVGKLSLRGNTQTKDKVILHQVRGLDPGQRFDRAGLEQTRKRLTQSPLFEKADVTVQGDVETPVRDVVVEVKERNTGSLSLGAGVNSDAGVLGVFELTQRNFDIADAPDSMGEFFTGKAFRGAGQYFALTLQPGTETSRYAVTFREPYLLESDYFLDTNVFYFTRQRSEYDEQRVGGMLGLGQRFGDVWSGSIRARGETIDISNVDREAAQDIWDVQGQSLITSLGPNITRDSTDDRFFPTQGSRMDANIVRAGALGGDYDFTSAGLEYRKYWTVDEDFFRRRTVFSSRTEIGYIIDGEAPIFERFYAGGHRSLRGFAFRGIGPHGQRHDKPDELSDNSVGGDWLFIQSFEYNFPVYEDTVRIVLFTDTGTVQKSIGFDQYRVSVGTGLRIKIPFLGQAPFALDFALPIMKQSDDDTRVVSFDLALPF